MDREEDTVGLSPEIPMTDVSTQTDGSADNSTRAELTLDGPAMKRLIRKIDLTLIPFLALLYLLSFLDRTNIGNARLAGIETDLRMGGLDYNNALAIFFPFYVAAEIPSNVMMKKFRPSIWIPSIMVAWGLVCALMGLVTSYEGLLAARAALGVAEGGLFPGVTFYITMWYKRHECGLRMAVFFSAATAAGAFGGLLARGIVELDGVGGKAGWSWIFILEGIATVVIAVAAFWLMHDYPETAEFLTPSEKAVVKHRLEEDQSSLTDGLNIKYFWQALQDWKIWVHMFITIGIYTPLYSIALFLPTIVKSLGFTNNTAQLMTVPPYVVACLFCIGGGIVADKHQQRGIYMIGFCLVAITGFTMLLASDAPRVKYAGAILAASGIYPNVPQGVAWNGNNIGGSLKRGVGIAMHVGFGNLGGAIAGFIYQTKDGPDFRHGHGTLIGTLSMSVLLSCFMTSWLRRENARRDHVHASRTEEYKDEEILSEREKGDASAFFRYTV